MSGKTVYLKMVAILQIMAQVSLTSNEFIRNFDATNILFSLVALFLLKVHSFELLIVYLAEWASMIQLRKIYQRL